MNSETTNQPISVDNIDGSRPNSQTIAEVSTITRENFIDMEQSELAKTRQAVSEVLSHDFRFGYEYALQNDKVVLSWNKNKSLSINITPCEPEDNVWFGNCYDDAWVSQEFLKSRVGQGSKITVQRIESNNFVGKMAYTEHYRLLVEHHDSNGQNSVFTEIDHSSFYRKTASGEKASIISWVETNYIQEGTRDITRQDSDSFLPMCEYEIDGKEKILYFKFEIDEEEEAVYIKMQQMDSSDVEQKLDALRYPIYFNQLDNPQVVLSDIENNTAFKPEGPFGNQMHEETLEHIKNALLLIVAKMPPYKHQE